MKVLLDEMYSGLKPFLRLLGWEVHTVDEEGLRGAEDEQVVEQAARRGLVLVTQEQRVHELARLRGVPCVLVGFGDIARIVDEKLRGLVSPRESQLVLPPAHQAPKTGKPGASERVWVPAGRVRGPRRAPRPARRSSPRKA